MKIKINFTIEITRTEPKKKRPPQRPSKEPQQVTNSNTTINITQT